jgi:hypothetical protein
MVFGKPGGATTRSNISALSWIIVTDAFNQSVFGRKRNYMAWTPS